MKKKFKCLTTAVVLGGLTLGVWSFVLTVTVCAQTNVPPPEPPERILESGGVFEGRTERPLRYTPDGTDFVITNGTEFFNRPLYCINTAFRVDAGDKPEFSIYLPGRGGNLRFGIKTPAGVKWLHDAEQIITRYRPGSMLYEIRDPLLGNRQLHLVVCPLNESKGFVARAELNSAWMPVELVWAFGGLNGMRGRRNGDIGCENEPISRFFQLRPDQCKENKCSVATNIFIVRGKPAVIVGTASSGATHVVSDANRWADLSGLLRSADETNDLPVVVGRITVQQGQPVYVMLQQQIAPADNATALASAPRSEDMPKFFEAAEQRRRTVAGRVVVDTPDPFINSAVAALNVAGDGIWDAASGTYMHGAVAWRNKLLGWRGPYTADALGWHDRARRHFTYWAGQQVTNEIPDSILPADPTSNLSRNEPALHSNGTMSKSHYDMNLVYIDALFRHFLWTGDTNFAREMWPVIERHLAWERRLFRREFGPEKLPLYEAYAAIWASDDMAYHGGGATHTTAYNYWHNKMAARMATLLGKDVVSYEREEELISKAMRQYLWLPREGCFAEWKDYLGLQLVHPNPGLWTIYHTIDSEAATPAEAWQMTRFVDSQIAHIPIHGPGVPNENLFTLPTTSWMPYTWSLNNVVMAEVAHTSLAYWQANRADAAFSIFKGSLLDSMFMGLCPGNVGMTTYFDMARHEAQRDFADAVGITSRALVEGLFGVQPDALSGELKIRPGFPAEWDKASIRHPNFNFNFRRDGLTEIFSIEPTFPRAMKLVLQIPALRDQIGGVTINGEAAKWNWIEGIYGVPKIEIQSGAAVEWKIAVTWNGGKPIAKKPPDNKQAVSSDKKVIGLDWHKKIRSGKLEMINLTSLFNDRVTQIFRNEYLTPRSPFCSLAIPKQGIGSWCHYQEKFDVDDSGLRRAAAANGGKFAMPNGVLFQTPTNEAAKNIVFTSQWDNYPREAGVPLTGKARHAYLLMAGSTSAMQSRFDNGEVLVTYMDGTTEQLALNNPVNWWPIDQDYFIDDYAFRRPEPIPPRVDLKTGTVRVLDVNEFKGKGGKVPGGAATALDVALDPKKELKSLTVRTLANEVVIGLMAVTLER